MPCLQRQVANEFIKYELGWSVHWVFRLWSRKKERCGQSDSYRFSVESGGVHTTRARFILISAFSFVYTSSDKLFVHRMSDARRREERKRNQKLWCPVCLSLCVTFLWLHSLSSLNFYCFFTFLCCDAIIGPLPVFNDSIEVASPPPLFLNEWMRKCAAR